MFARQVVRNERRILVQMRQLLDRLARRQRKRLPTVSCQKVSVSTLGLGKVERIFEDPHQRQQIGVRAGYDYGGLWRGWVHSADPREIFQDPSGCR